MSESGETFIHPSAIVDDGARLGAGVHVWHFSHVMDGAEIGADCTLGQNVFVARGVRVGAGTKIQNNVSLYDGVEIGERCFIAPSVVFTNVKTPRAEVSRRDDYHSTRVEEGATLGANSTIICGVTIGRYAVVGAGAVVTRDVAPFRLMVGVPAREEGWACRCGVPLPPELACAECGRAYRTVDSALEEEAPQERRP